MTAVADLLATATNLPTREVESLAEATLEGRTALNRLRARTGSPVVRTACEQVATLLEENDRQYLVGWLNGAAAASEQRRQTHQLDVVWTGPRSEIDTSRFTSEVIVDLIAQAHRSLLLASYATYPQERVLEALADAVDRGVDVSVLYERIEDNPAFRSGSDALAGLGARRLTWPIDRRPVGAALHPKLVVVDEQVALVGSANLTGRGLDVNIECGILIRGGQHPKAISDHIWSLVRAGELSVLPGPAAVN